MTTRRPWSGSVRPSTAARRFTEWALSRIHSGRDEHDDGRVGSRQTEAKRRENRGLGSVAASRFRHPEHWAQSWSLYGYRRPGAG